MSKKMRFFLLLTHGLALVNSAFFPFLFRTVAAEEAVEARSVASGADQDKPA